jgi:hypothetical protein
MEDEILEKAVEDVRLIKNVMDRSTDSFNRMYKPFMAGIAGCPGERAVFNHCTEITNGPILGRNFSCFLARYAG